MTSGPENKEANDAGDEVIRSLSGRKWVSLGKVTQENFKSLLENSETACKFGETYITSVAERWRELTKWSHKLLFGVIPVVLIIGAINAGPAEKLVFFRLEINKTNGTLEILILLASLLIITKSLLLMMAQHYGSIVKSFAEVNSDSKTMDYYMLQFGWTTEAYWEGLTNPEKHLSAPIVTIFPLFGMAFGLIVVMVLVALLEFFIMLDATISIYRNPLLPMIINVPIVLIASSALLCRASLLLFNLPLPYSDYSNLHKLQDLEESEPARAETIKQNLADISSRNERRNVRILQIVAMLGTMATLYLVDVGTRFYAEYSIDFVLASGFFLLFILPRFDQMEKKSIYAAVEIEDSDLRLNQYTKVKRWALRLRLLFSALFGAISFLWFYLEPLANL